MKTYAFPLAWYSNTHSTPVLRPLIHPQVLPQTLHSAHPILLACALFFLLLVVFVDFYPF